MFGVSRPQFRRRLPSRRRRSAALAALCLAGGSLAGAMTARADGGGLITSFSAAPVGAAPAGSPATLRLAMGFAGSGPAGSPQDISVTFAPGLTMALGAVPVRCSPADLAAASCPAASRIAHGAAQTNVGSAAVWLFAMDAPSSTALAGVGLVIALSTPPSAAGPSGPYVTATGTLALAPAAVGATPPLTLAISGIPGTVRVAGTDQPLTVRSMTVDIAGSVPDEPGVAGAPFIRLPTAGSADGCAQAVSSLQVVAADRGVSGTAASAFTPTGCGALPYAPELAAAVVRTGRRGTARVAIDLRQPTGAQDATSRFVLGAPVSLLSFHGPNGGCADETLATCGGDIVGRVTVSSPMTASPVDGLVLATSFNAPSHRSGLTFLLPPPIPFRFAGVISEPGNALTVTGLPDLPITDMSVIFTGGAAAPFRAPCGATEGMLLGSLLSFGGVGANADPPLTVAGCPSARRPAAIGTPTATATVAGLDRGAPAFTITIRAGARAPAISLLSFSLPAGLSLDAHAAGAGRGMALSAPGRVRISAGRFAARLARPVRSVTVTLSSPALRRDRSAGSRHRGGTARSATVGVGVIDAGGLESDLNAPVQSVPTSGRRR